MQPRPHRALQYLETLEMTADTESMWRTLGGLALHDKNLPVAERFIYVIKLWLGLQNQPSPRKLHLDGYYLIYPVLNE